MNIINLWKTVLPQSRAFSLIVTKTLRKFYESLTYPQYYRDKFDQCYKDLDPQATTLLERWEDQFYLPANGLTEQQRRDRLAATLKMTGGQSPAYLQGILRGYGFDVYVHDWWIPEEQVVSLRMGNEQAFMGGDGAFMGASTSIYPSAWDPNTLLVPPYYPLVNRTSTASYKSVTMGGDSAYMGGESAYMGAIAMTESGDHYPIPSDPIRFRGFFYIAAEEMPNTATVPLERKEELEELILAIFPAHLWGGILVDFI